MTLRTHSMLKHLASIRPLPPALGYGLAVITVALCFGFRIALTPVIGLESPFMIFVMAIMVTSWLGGFGPGLLALGMSAVLGLYAFVQPVGGLAPVNLSAAVQLGLFFILSVLACSLGSYARAKTRCDTAELERLRVALAGMDDAVITTGPTGQVTFVNSSAEQLIGLRYDEAIGQSVEEVLHLVPKASGANTASPVHAVLASGHDICLTNNASLIARDGSEYLIDYTVAPIKDNRGSLLGVVLVFRDVSEKLSADRTIRENEALFRILADSAPALIWMNDAEGAVFVNRAYLEFLGCDQDDVHGMDWASRLHDEDAENYVNEYLHAFNRRERFEAQFRFQRHDGVYRCLKSVGLPRYDSHGNFAGYVGCSFDITELVKMQQQESFLAAQRQLALNAANLGWWNYDPESKLVTCDERYAEIYGIEHRPWPVDDVAKLLHPEDAPRLWSAIQAAMDPHNPKSYTEQYRVIRPDGTLRWVEAHGLATFEGEGDTRRISNFVGTVADVTERRQVEAVLAESAKSLARERERLAIALGAARQGVYEWRVGESAIWWSPELYPVFGVEPSQFQPTLESFSALVHPDDRDELWRKTEESLSRHEQFVHEYRIIRPDGAER